MKRTLIASAVLLALGGCGGGGTSSTTNIAGGVSGYTLPTEISAVPTSSASSATAVRSTGFYSLLKGLSLTQLPSDSDYNTTQTKKYVEERALEQFAIIETIINALAQTNYALAENINQGPYTAIVAWEDEQGGRQQKTLQPWVVDSKMITENGSQVNQVQAWIEEPDEMNPGQLRTIRAEFKIYRSAAANADGSYRDYGEWDLNVSFNADNSSYFVATSRIDNAGVNTIMINEFGAGGPAAVPMKGILVRAGGSGYGKVSYPDWEWCWQNATGPNCTPPSKAAQYAYNSGYLVVDDDTGNGTGDAVYKDRDLTNAVELTHRYGLFYSDADSTAGIAAGDNLEKHKSFGFPVTFTDGSGLQHHAYYGAWQGRHEIWGGEDLSAGNTVTRADRGPNDPVVTYTVSSAFPGTLTRRALVAGSLGDIQGIPVETFVNDRYDLFYNATATAWQFCNGYVDWSGMTPVCRDFVNNTDIGLSTFSDFSKLVVGEADRKMVNISRWDPAAAGGMGGMVQYLYLAADPGSAAVTYSGPGFYPAQPSVNGMEPSGSIYTPVDGDQLGVDIGGSLYIQYTGDFTGGKTGWVEKKLLSFSEENWTPVFDNTGDVDFSPARDGEYYIHNNGANFIVRRISDADAAGSYDVKIELQTAANPANIASILPTGTAYLAAPWQADVHFSLVTDPTDSNFMNLVYLTDDPATPEDETASVTVLTSGSWGLQAYNSSGQPLQQDGTAVAVDVYGFPVDPTAIPAEYNWEYAAGGGWGSQRYLMSDASSYVILADPVQLAALTLNNGAGTSKTLMLQFDGWMAGLPDMYAELAKDDFQMSQEISDKVINIPAGTLVTDAGDGTTYYVKPLETSVFLKEVPSTTAGVPSLADADAVDLATVPGFTDHGMGATPQNTVVKYSEGKVVN